MTSFLTRRAALGLAAAALLAAPALAQTTNLRVHTSAPGTSAFGYTTTFQKIAQRELPVKFNVTSGMTSTRSTLDSARDQVDLYISSPAINYYMSIGEAMFKDIADAPQLFENVRGMLNFPLGPYHVVTYADSGIETLDDIKGKRVFAGPPGGAATVVGLAIIRGATGYVEDEDYELAKLDWSSGNQAFQDRQVDLAVIPTELPSANIQQFALLSKIRFIGITEKSLETEDMQRILSVPGRTIEEMPVGIYGPNQVNETPVKVVGSWIGIGVNKNMDEQLVYDLTRVTFENIEEFHQAAEWMKVITLEKALANFNAPLHPGALRYYREMGVEVPDALIPPEAR